MIGAAVAPLAVTQDNCLAACGLEPRQFLALIHKRNIPYVKLGKTRLVKAADLLAALTAEVDAPATTGGAANDGEPATQAGRLERAAGLA